MVYQYRYSLQISAPLVLGLILLLCSSLLARGYEPFLSFSASKTQLNTIHALHKVLPISGCRYHFDPKGCSVAGIIEYDSCDLIPYSDPLQAKQVDWMHIMLPHKFGQGRECMASNACLSTYRKRPYGGVRCCKKIDAEFNKMYSDMHNIIPVAGGYRTIRNKQIFCEPSLSGIEPDRRAKGWIARAYLYMIKEYGLKVDKAYIKIWHRWNRKYPPSSFEIEREEAIYKLQGTRNPYIYRYDSMK